MQYLEKQKKLGTCVSHCNFNFGNQLNYIRYSNRQSGKALRKIKSNTNIPSSFYSSLATSKNPKVSPPNTNSLGIGMRKQVKFGIESKVSECPEENNQLIKINFIEDGYSNHTRSEKQQNQFVSQQSKLQENEQDMFTFRKKEQVQHQDNKSQCNSMETIINEISKLEQMSEDQKAKQENGQTSISQEEPPLQVKPAQPIKQQKQTVANSKRKVVVSHKVNMKPKQMGSNSSKFLKRFHKK